MFTGNPNPWVSADIPQTSFPTEMVGPRVGIFLSPLKTNDGFSLSHIPLPAHWKDGKRTATHWQHAGHTSIRDVIVMIKLRHHVAYHGIRIFWKYLPCFFPVQNEEFSGEKEK